MSNKPWRNPANPDFKTPAVDASIPEAQATNSSGNPAAAGGGTARREPGEPGNPAGGRGGGGATVGAQAAPAEPPRPASADVPLGAGKGFVDLRFPVRVMDYQGHVASHVTHDEVERMLANCDRLCAMIVEITARVLETVPLGEVRQLVASELAMSGAAVMQDGTVLDKKHLPPAAADPAKRPRARSHPLLTLVKIAMQAVRLLRQVTFGTHPEATRKRKITPEQEESYEQTYNKLGNYVSSVT